MKTLVNISFGKSSSGHFGDAVALAVSLPGYRQLDHGPQVRHLVEFEVSLGDDSWDQLERLIPLIAGWRSASITIDGHSMRLRQFLRTVVSIKQCYSQKLRQAVGDCYCSGKSTPTANNPRSNDAVGQSIREFCWRPRTCWRTTTGAVEQPQHSVISWRCRRASILDLTRCLHLWSQATGRTSRLAKILSLFRRLVVFVGERLITTIRTYPNNPRCSDAAVDAVARSIQEFGFCQPIVIDESGVIVVGHVRYRAALKLGLNKVAGLARRIIVGNCHRCQKGRREPRSAAL